MKKEEHISLLIQQDQSISLEKWEEIVRSLLLFSDEIWLHKSAISFDSSLDDSIKKHMSNTIQELNEAGYINFYSYESDSDNDKTVSSRVITKEEHIEIYDSIVEKIRVPSNLSWEQSADPDRTSMIIEKRNELWKYGIASILNLDLSLTQVDKNIKFTTEIQNDSLNLQLTNELFNAFEIPSVAHFNANDIVEFKKIANRNNVNIQPLILEIKQNQNLSVQDVAQEKFKNSIMLTNELLNNVDGSKAIKNLVLNSTLSVCGLLPVYAITVPITALVCGKEFHEFLKNKDKFGFVVFFNAVKKKTMN